MAEQKARKCLACGYLNQNAEDSCSACGSSLQLKLCSGCEAINTSRAERCHACGSAFVTHEEPRGLPMTIEASAAAPARRTRQLAALVVLPIAGTLGLAYYVYGLPLLGAKSAPAQPAHVAQAPHPRAPSTPEPLAKSTEQPVVKTADLSPVRETVNARTSRTTSAPPAPEPVMRTRVTHTKGPMKDEKVGVTPPVRATVRATSVRSVSTNQTKSETCGDAAATLGFCTKQGGR